MKKFYLGFVASALIFCGDICSQTVTVDGLNYNLLSTETCSLTTGDYSGNIVIPDEIEVKGRTLKVTVVEAKALSNLSELTGVEIGKNVYSFGEHSFVNTPNLEKLVIPATVASFGTFSFNNCGIKELVIEGNSECTSLQLGCSSYDSRYDISQPNAAPFKNCPNLKKVSISRMIWQKETNSNVYGKYRSAFYECKSIREAYVNVEFMESATYDSEVAFDRCESLEKIEFGPDVKVVGGLSSCNLKNIYIPGNVERVSKSCFDFNENIETVVMEEGVKTVEVWAFSNCGDGVKTFTVPSTIEEGYFEFPGLEKLTINSVKGKLNFGGALSALKELRYGAGVESTSPSVLSSAKDLNEIHVGRLEPPVCLNEFTTQQYFNATLYVPSQSLEKYKEANVWKNFWEIVGEEYNGSIDAVEDDNNFSVKIDKGSIEVNSFNGIESRIYNTSGLLMGRGVKIELSTLMPGMYIISNSGVTRKVMIK